MAKVFVGVTELASQYIAVPGKLRDSIYADIATGTASTVSTLDFTSTGQIWAIKPLDAEIRVSFGGTAAAEAGWPVAAGEWFYSEITDGMNPSIYVVG